jgi:hypothetical protein
MFLSLLVIVEVFTSLLSLFLHICSLGGYCAPQRNQDCFTDFPLSILVTGIGNSYCFCYVNFYTGTLLNLFIKSIILLAESLVSSKYGLILSSKRDNLTSTLFVSLLFLYLAFWH